MRLLRALAALCMLALLLGPRAVHGAPTPTLTAAFDADFSTLDPAIGYDPFSWTGEHAIFDALLGYRNEPGLAGTQLVPDLAASLPAVTDGGLVYTFRLRPELRFSPPVNRPVTAQDVRYSIERALAKSTNGPMYESPFWSSLAGTTAFWSGHAAHISGIHVLGPRTVQFQLRSPDRAFENVLAMPFASVVPREVVTREGKSWADHPVGTGPYMLQSWQHGRQMVLVRNPNYRGADTPHVPRVLIQFNVDDHLQILRAEKGQLDLPGNLVTSTDYLALRTGQYARQLVSAPDIAVFYLAMNTRMAPFRGNVALRRAFNMAIDKAHIVRLLNGRAIPMNGILPPTMPGANPHFQMYNYNPAAARAELQRAGYKPGQLHLTLLLINTPDYEKVADAVQADLGRIGVNVTLRPESSDTVYNEIYTPGKTAFTLITWGQDYPDPSDFFDPILSCAGSSNAAFYCNPAVDRLGNQARGDLNTARRYATYREMERMVMQDAPWVPLYDDILYDFRGARVRGFYIHPVWPFNYAQYWLAS